MASQLVLEVVEVDGAGAVLAYRHELRGRLSPRQLTGVVLVGPDEHHGSVLWIPRQQADQLVDRAGRSGAAEDHDVVLGAVDRLVNETTCLLAGRGGVSSRRRCLRVRVAVHRQHLVADEVLDERERAPRGRGVRVDHAARAERAVEHGVVADHRAPDPVDQALFTGAPRGKPG